MVVSRCRCIGPPSSGIVLGTLLLLAADLLRHPTLASPAPIHFASPALVLTPGTSTSPTPNPYSLRPPLSISLALHLVLTPGTSPSPTPNPYSLRPARSVLLALHLVLPLTLALAFTPAPNPVCVILCYLWVARLALPLVLALPLPVPLTLILLACRYR